MCSVEGALCVATGNAWHSAVEVSVTCIVSPLVQCVMKELGGETSVRAVMAGPEAPAFARVHSVESG
jgi:hypothetical protein